MEDLCQTTPCKNNMICLHVEGKMSPECICPPGLKDNGRSECVDIRDPEKIYENIDPFILQKHGCDQFYSLENNKVVCSCLPGYRRDPVKNQCVLTFVPDIKTCDCNENQHCIKSVTKEKGELYKCVCKAG